MQTADRYCQLHLTSCNVANKRLKERYPGASVADFANKEKLPLLESFWFFKGCPVELIIFQDICKKLDMDWMEAREKE